MMRRHLATLLAAALVLAAGCATPPKAFPPPAGRGPIAIVISGLSGSDSFQDEATRISQLGYYTMLLDGNDVDPRSSTGATRLRDAITRASSAPEARPGKVVVVGFSMGGGGALVHAAPMGNLVAAVVAYYPFVEFLREETMHYFTARLEAPVLVLAGADDTYRDCCRVGAQRALEAAARSQGKEFELVVYPGADHGFNLRGDSAAHEDAERRTDEMLRRHLPLQ